MLIHLKIFEIFPLYSWILNNSCLSCDGYRSLQKIFHKRKWKSFLTLSRSPELGENKSITENNLCGALLPAGGWGPRPWVCSTFDKEYKDLWKDLRKKQIRNKCPPILRFALCHGNVGKNITRANSACSKYYS